MICITYLFIITEINADIGRRSETIKRWNIDVSEKAQQASEEESTWQLASTTLPLGMLINGEKKIQQQSAAEKGIQQSPSPATAAAAAAVGNNQVASSSETVESTLPVVAAAAAAAAGNNQEVGLLDSYNREISTKDAYYKKIRDGPLKKCGKCGIEKKKWSYINAEWNKLEDDRMCQVCIKAEIKSNPAAVTAAKQPASNDAAPASPQIKMGVQRELQVHSYSKEKSNWVNDGLKYLAPHEYAAQAAEHQNVAASKSNNDIVSPSPQPLEKSMEKRGEDEEKAGDKEPANDETVYLGEAQIVGCGTSDVNGTYSLQNSMYIKQEKDDHHPSGSTEAKDSYAIHYQNLTVRGSFEQVGYWFISMWKGDITDNSEPLVHMYRSRMNADCRVPPKDGWEALYGNDPPPFCQMKGKDDAEDKLRTDTGGKTEETSDEQGSLESGNGTHITPVGSSDSGSSAGSSGIAMLAKAAQSDLLHSLFQPNTKVAKDDSNDNMEEDTFAAIAQLDVTQTRSGRKITPSSKKKEAATKYIPIKKPAPERVSLEVAAISGCDKCNKELETGVRRNNESHSDQCPRKMWGKSEKPPQKRKHTASKKPPQKRRKQSEMKPSGKGIEVPTTTDILKGRGRLTNDHEGNMRLRDEARKLRGDYQDGYYGKSEKKYQYSLELVKRVRSYGGRFLEKRGDDNLWYEMSEEDTRKKAAQGEILYVCYLSLSSC